MSPASTPERIRLRVAMDQAAAAGRWGEVEQLEAAWRQEVAGDRPTLDNLEARLERLDARVKQAPGQMGLDLSGAGTGKPCGESHIAASKTCHKGGGTGEAPAAAGPIDTKQRFSPETMERLKSSIEQRTFAVALATRQDGSDLAEALGALASADGPQGEHGREVMAFMDEVQAIVQISPSQDHLPNLKQKLSPPAPMKGTTDVDAAMEKLDAYLLEGEQIAERGRNFGRRAGILSEERLQVLQADRSPWGEAAAKELDMALHSDPPDRARFEAMRQELRDKAAAYKASGSDEDLLRVQDAYERVRLQTWGLGPHKDMMAVQQALNVPMALPGTGGHYNPTGNGYVIRSEAGREGAQLKIGELRPAAMQAAMDAAITLRAPKPHTLSRAQGLTGSERSLATHLHELGHLVHDASQRRQEESDDGEGLSMVFYRDSTKRFSHDVRKELLADNGPSRYADTNPAEMFAESFVAYVIAPQALLDQNRTLYNWVRDNLAKARENARAGQNADSWYSW